MCCSTMVCLSTSVPGEFGGIVMENHCTVCRAGLSMKPPETTLKSVIVTDLQSGESVSVLTLFDLIAVLDLAVA